MAEATRKRGGDVRSIEFSGHLVVNFDDLVVDTSSLLFLS